MTVAEAFAWVGALPWWLALSGAVFVAWLACGAVGLVQRAGAEAAERRADARERYVRTGRRD